MSRRAAHPGANTRRRWTSIVVAVFAVLAIQALIGRATAATHDPAATGLKDVLGTLGDVDSVGPLGQPLPLSDSSPAELLGIDSLFDDLSSTLGESELTPASFEALEGSHGPFEVVVDGPDGAEEALVAPSPGDPDIRDIVLQITATATDVELPVSVADDLLDFDGTADPDGGTVAVDAVLSSTMLHFQHDDSETEEALLPQALWLRTLPADPVPAAEREAPQLTLDLTADGATVQAFDANVGIGDVEVSGSLDLNARVVTELLDPDGDPGDGRITLDELTSTDVLDLVEVGFVDVEGVDDVDADLDVVVTSAGGFSEGHVTLVDDDLSSDPPPEPDFQLDDLERLLNMTPADLIGAVERLSNWLGGISTSGRLDPEIPFLGGSFSDALDMGATLAELTITENDVLRHAGDIEGTPIDETGTPKFSTLAELDTLLADAGYPVEFTFADDRLGFELAVSDSDDTDLPVSIGSLDVVDQISTSGEINLSASYLAQLDVALDLSPLPREGDGGPLSCVDGLDNDGTDGTDAADPDCADTPTLEQRVLLDVGPDSGSPEVTAGLGLSTDSLAATGRIGLLEVTLDPISATLGDGEGNDAAIDLDLHESGDDADGLLTVEELTAAFGGDPGDAVVESSIDADFSADLDVDASFEQEGPSLGGGSIGVTATADGPFTDPTLLTDANFEVHAENLHAAPIFSFSPCDNDEDDDGDGVANDGCPDGPDPVADPESESTAALQSVIELVRSLAGQFETAGLDEEIPLLGRNFSELVDLTEPLEALVDRLADPAEASIPGACDAGNDDDDDFDGVVNDGCPTRGSSDDPDISPAPESGAACRDDIDATDDDDEDFVNDGCPPVAPSVQALAGMIEGLVAEQIETGLEELALEGSTPEVTASVAPSYDTDARDLSFLLTVGLEVRTGSAFNVDLGDVSSDLADFEIAALEASGEIALDVDADLVVGFGLELDGLTPYMLGDTSLDVTVDAAGEDLEIGAGIGPLKLQLGNEEPVPEDQDAGECDPGNEADEDGDGFVNDGCDAVPHAETEGECLDGEDDDGDGVADDGCPEAAEEAGDEDAGEGPEEGDDCGNGQDDDGDGVADDGCGSDTADATDGDGGPEPEDADAGECDRDNTADEDDDGLVNDGCPARGNPGLAYVGATLGLSEAGDDGEKRYFGDAPGIDFSGSTGLGSSPPEQCDDLVGNDTADACASLPIYLDVDGELTFLSPLTIDWDDFDAAPDITLDEEAVLDAIGEQMIDLLLLESGLGKWLDRIEAQLREGLFDLDLPLIGDALDDAADFVAGLRSVESALSGELTGENPLAGLTDVDAVVAAVDDLAVALDDALPDDIQEPNGSFEPVSAEVLCDDGEGGTEPCDTGGEDGEDGEEGPSIGDIEDIVFTVPLGQQGQESTQGFDIGVPGLGLASEDGIDVTGSWAITVSMGVSRTDGFFVDTSQDPELSLGAEIDLPDHIEGRLGFLAVDILNGGPSTACSEGSEVLHGVETCDVDNDGEALPESSFDPSFTVDLLGIDDDRLTAKELTGGAAFDELFSYTMDVPAEVNLHIVTSIAETGGSMPRLLTDLTLDWGFAVSDSGDPDELRDPEDVDIALSNVGLDAGSFLRDFVGPIVQDAKVFTEPLEPVIDQLNAPIPVLSDFAGSPVTLLDLIEQFASGEVELGLLFDLVKMVDFINGLDVPEASEGLFIVPLDPSGGGVGAAAVGDGGRFDLDENVLFGGPLDQSQARSVFDGADLAALDDAGSLVGALDEEAGPASNSEVGTASGLSDIGLFFPFLDQPSQLMGLVFGQDADLVIWQPDELSAEFAYSQKFGPIWSVPPVFLEVGGSAKVTGRFGIGYDTQGLREILFEGSDAGALLHGMFLLDHRLQEDGTFAPGDPAEIELSGRLFANAQVSVVVFSAGAEGSVFMTVGLNIHDDNNDGKLKYQEAADILRATHNPMCLFDFEGEFGVSIDVFAEVDLFLWSQKWVKNLAEVILYEWEVNCADPKEPTLATPRTADLGNAIDLDDTDAYPRPDDSTGDFYGPGDENVLELNLGALRHQRGENTVGGDETNEEFLVQKEIDESVTVTALGISQNFPAPDGGWDAVVVDGGDDDDSDENDPGFDVITLADNVQKGENEPVQGDGSESASNRCGADATDNDRDEVVNDGCPAEGEPETDEECANARDDDEDGFVNDGCPVVETEVAFDLDAYITGSDGADQITGGHGKHVIWGAGGDDQISTKGGQDKVAGEGGADQIGLGDDPNTVGQEDYASGGPGDDVIDGGPGRDLLHGDDGDDVVTGGLTIPAQPGDPDELTGDIDEQPDGPDEIYGGPGEDDLEGGPAGDLLVGGGDADRLNGGEGADTLWGDGEDQTALPPLIGSLDDCFEMPSDSSYHDVIVGGPGADTAHGGPFDDIVVGGNVTAGADDVGDTLLEGNTGCDLILGDNARFSDPVDPRRFEFIDPDVGGGDVMSGGPGADVIHGMIGDDVAGGDEHEDLLFGEAGDDTLDGGGDDDVVWGDGGPDQPVPYPGAGDDHVIGGSGDDELHGEEGRDVMLGDEGSVDDGEVELTGGSGVDEMFGGRDDDRMYGQASDDVMRGDSGHDLMLGNDGADDMRGGIGDDEMFGGDGDTTVDPPVGDTMRGDAGVDRMVGGSDVDAGWPVPDDGRDRMFGGSGPDVMIGDNGVITPDGVETLQSDGTPDDLGGLGGDGDLMFGEAADDAMFGELGNDVMYGGTGDDYMEGNANGDGPGEGEELCADLLSDPHADHLYGQADSDDLVGGGDDPGFADGADCIHGGGNVDVMTGDNAVVTRPEGDDAFDAYDGSVTRHVDLLDLFADDQTGIAGADAMFGGDGPDRMFGGGFGEQVMHGDGGDDYMEGNGGGDTIYGDAGQDDVIGGTAQNDEPGSVFTGRHVAPGGNPPDGPIGGGVPDGVDTIFGDDDSDDLTGGDPGDHDLIAGDNAALVRPVDGSGHWFLDDLDADRGVTDVARRVLQLHDVATDEEPDADDGVSGGDELYGQNGFDVVYGQGGDDTIRGGVVDDYLEGGNGSDDIQGNDGQDDVVGGTGRTRTDDPSSADDGRLDDADTLYGGNGDPSEADDGSDADDYDVIMGDNATVLRGATGAPGEAWTHHDFGGAGVPVVDRTVTLHDVETVDYAPPAASSGGDTLVGEDADDLLHGQGGDDTAHGGGGDDHIQGNAGDDLLLGEADQDDILGGTGLVRWWDELAGEIKIDDYEVDELVGGTPGRVDGADTMYGGADHDVMLGDNGIIDRLADGAETWDELSYGHFPDGHDATDPDNEPEVTGSFARWVRTVRMTDAPVDEGGSPLTSGSDVMSGGEGDDDMYGQFDDTADDPAGSFSLTATEIGELCPTSRIGEPADGEVELWGDLVCGGAGEDAVLGDQGVVTNEVASGPAEFIAPKNPFVTEWIDLPGSLVRRTELTTFASGGDDVLLGGSESDSIHAGAGGDVVNAGEGDDRVFGGDSPRVDDGGRLDALWGGPDNDHIYGGHGDDFADVQPRSGVENFPDDPEQWFVFAPVVDEDPEDDGPNGDGFDRFPGFEGFDQIYGGWNQDALQADEGDNGPVRGDRLLDWAGAHNIYYLCPSTYGAYVSIRAQEPGLLDYLEDMAEADGLVDVRDAGSSGYDELALVYKPDVKDNARPPHPDTPGHFSCDFVPDE